MPKRQASAKPSSEDEATPSKDSSSFFLMKSEPHVFSIDDLAACENQTNPWDGVRNYQARNLMEQMGAGTQAFFYHSSCSRPGVVGIVEVTREAYEDHTALDPKSSGFDEKLAAKQPDKPNPWRMVDVRLVRKLARPVTLEAIRVAAAKDGGGSRSGGSSSGGGSSGGGSGGGGGGGGGGEGLVDMVLLRNSRLSVQPVTDEQWVAVLALEEEGGREEEKEITGSEKKQAAAAESTALKKAGRAGRRTMSERTAKAARRGSAAAVSAASADAAGADATPADSG